MSTVSMTVCDGCGKTIDPKSRVRLEAKTVDRSTGKPASGIGYRSHHQAETDARIEIGTDFCSKKCLYLKLAKISGVNEKTQAQLMEQIQSKPLRDVLDEIKAERRRQDAKWGGPPHDDQHDVSNWCNYIMGHVEDCEDVYLSRPDEARKELIQVAALAVAAVQSFDRKQGDQE